MKRGRSQKVKDFITFPVRAVTLFEKDSSGLSSLASERFDYVSKEVAGYCLDVGCGRHNRFINEYLMGQGKGIDVFPYEGLTEENIVQDMTKMPFPDESFDSITFIANINHIPTSIRLQELQEAYRCLRHGGNIIVTMGNPVAEVLVHKLVWFYDNVFGTKFDMDSERGMDEEESYFLTDAEITNILIQSGFQNIKKRYFTTQWFLNHLFVGWKA